MEKLRRIFIKFSLTVFVAITSITFLNSCKISINNENKSFEKELSKKNYSASELIKSQPAPILRYSHERKILSRRIKEWNDPNKMLYLYIFTPTNIVYFVTVKGKLASTSKRLTPPWMKIRCDKGEYMGDCIVQAPDIMGTWGHSKPSKIGVMTNNGLIEIGGFTGYVLVDTPLEFSKETKLIEIKVGGDER